MSRPRRGPCCHLGAEADKGAHLKATGSGKTTLRRRGPAGKEPGEGVSREMETSSFRSPPDMDAESLGVELLRLAAASLDGVSCSSSFWFWVRPSVRESLNDIVSNSDGTGRVLYSYVRHPTKSLDGTRAPRQRLVHVGRPTAGAQRSEATLCFTRTMSCPQDANQSHFRKS